jgi:hypothetical protein
MQTIVMLNVIDADFHIQANHAECDYAEGRNAECNYAECRYADCHYTDCRGALLK